MKIAALRVEKVQTGSLAPLLGALVLLGAGCAVRPVQAPRIVIPETVASEVQIQATMSDRFGGITPIAIGLSNGSQDTWEITADHIFAIDEYGQRIAPLSLREAARQAGGETVLAANLRGAGAGALSTAALGAATGAIAGSAHGHSGQGALIGTAVGLAVGALGGFGQSAEGNTGEVEDQLESLYLGSRTVKPGMPASGFVFFPAGRYTAVRVIAKRSEDGLVHEFHGRASVAERLEDRQLGASTQSTPRS